MSLRGHFITLFALLLGSVVLGAAQPPAPSPAAIPAELTLAEAQRLALDRNTDLRVAQTQVDAAIAQFRGTREFPNPTLGLSTAKINTDRLSNRTASGNSLLDRSYDSIVSLSQLLEIGKRGPRQDSARFNQRATEAQRDDVRRLVIKAVSQAFVAAIEAREESAILANSAASLRREADLATVRLSAGDLARTDKAQIEIAATQRELDAADARHTATTAVLALETLLGDPAPTGRTRLAESLTDLAAGPGELTEESSAAPRPDLAAADATLAKTEADLQLQQHGKIPDLTVSAQFEHNPPDAPNTVGLGVSLPLPLWNRNTSAIHAARAARDQAQVLREKTQAQISADIAGARLDFRESHERANAYRRDLTAKSASVVQTVDYAYAHGGASLLELLAAERNDNDIRVAAARAQAEAASATFALRAALNLNSAALPSPSR
ncbi:MAG: TolC family protein [Lacunisphaera sp.]